MPKNISQKGFAPVLLLVAVLGLIAFLVVTQLAQFNTGVFKDLYSKLPLFAQAPGVIFIDDGGAQITQTTSPTVKVSLFSPWGVATTSLDSDDSVADLLVKNAYAHSTTGGGLLGKYYDNRDFTGTSISRVDPKIDFNWGNGSPASGIGPDTFSVRWTGYVIPDEAETYTFYAQTDDGVRLWVNNQRIINYWKDRGFRQSSGMITLNADQAYTIQMDYYENKGGAAARLSWSSPSTPKQVIPQANLYTQNPGGGPTPVPSILPTPTLTPQPTSVPPSTPTATTPPTRTPAPITTTPTPTPAPTSTPAPITTMSVLMSDDSAFVENVITVSPFVANPTITSYTFSNASLGTKILYVKYVSSTGTTQVYSSSIQLVAPPSPTPTPPTVTNQPTLLEFYYMKKDLQDYGIMKYRPRQFNTNLNWDPGDNPGTIRVTNPGPYKDWDILNTPSGTPANGYNGIVAEPEWVKIGLNRAAKLAIVWRGGSSIPSWLSSWTNTGSDGNVDISGNTYPTYTKSFVAGEYFFGSMYSGSTGSDLRDSYLVLFAEANGQPTPDPIVPAGLDVPVANNNCPLWVHPQYTAVGPDGKTYETWHNIIDPVYWCYFGHEHGSNPKYFGPNFKPLYQYTSKQDEMDEPHAGFKGVYFEDTENGTTTQVYYTMHFGTAGIKRACTRFHTVDIAFKDKPTGKLLADLHTMADFGISTNNDQFHRALTPVGCPTQGTDVLYSDLTNHGEKQFPIPGFAETLTYEPWRIDARNLEDNLGLRASSLMLNTINPIVTCDTVNCASPYTITGSKGDQRYGQYGPLGIRPTTFNQGTFYTNGQGTMVLTQNDPGAVQQFAAPGANFGLTLPSDDTNCQDSHGFGLPFVCEGGAPNGYPADRENSLRSPN